jgi:hypothetical protein
LCSIGGRDELQRRPISSNVVLPCWPPGFRVSQVNDSGNDVGTSLRYDYVALMSILSKIVAHVTKRDALNCETGKFWIRLTSTMRIAWGS